MRYQLKIYSLGRTIIFHNRKLRTPVSLVINEKDFQQIKIQFNKVGILRKEYSLQEIPEDDSIDILPKEIVLNNRNLNFNNDQLSVPEIEELLGMENKK